MQQIDFPMWIHVAPKIQENFIKSVQPMSY